METHYYSEDEKPHCHCEAGKIKDLQQALNSINALLLLIVMSCVRSCLKSLRFYWYRSMQLFITNVKLVIKKKIVACMIFFLVIDLLLVMLC